MYCPQCGGANEDSVKNCSTCGQDLEEYRRQWEQTAPAAAAQVQPGAMPDQPGAMADQPGHAPSPAPAQPYAQPYQPPYQASPAPTYQQPYQSPPPYQSQPPYQQQYQQVPQPYGYGNAPRIPSYLGWAIVTLILCFWPTGIVAVVYASQVGNKLAVGDFVGAKESSRKAKIWCWVTFGIAMAGVVIAILIVILAAATTFNTY